MMLVVVYKKERTAIDNSRRESSCFLLLLGKSQTTSRQTAPFRLLLSLSSTLFAAFSRASIRVSPRSRRRSITDRERMTERVSILPCRLHSFALNRSHDFDDLWSFTLDKQTQKQKVYLHARNACIVHTYTHTYTRTERQTNDVKSSASRQKLNVNWLAIHATVIQDARKWHAYVWLVEAADLPCQTAIQLYRRFRSDAGILKFFSPVRRKLAKVAKCKSWSLITFNMT